VKPRPEPANALVLRTDFSDDAAWATVCQLIRAPSGDFRSYVDCVSDPAFDGVTAAEVVSGVRPGSGRTFLFVVDRETIEDPEHPVMVVDLYARPGRTFRVVPAEMWAVENNLSLANLDFDDFADAVGPDGIYRGFA
jgi:hypothetical protein